MRPLPGIPPGRVLGVPVRLDLSFIVGLAVVVALSHQLWAPDLAGAAAWQATLRWLPQVVLGLFLWRAAGEGERSAARGQPLAGPAGHG